MSKTSEVLSTPNETRLCLKLITKCKDLPLKTIHYANSESTVVSDLVKAKDT